MIDLGYEARGIFVIYANIKKSQSPINFFFHSEPYILMLRIEILKEE